MFMYKIYIHYTFIGQREACSTLLINVVTKRWTAQGFTVGLKQSCIQVHSRVNDQVHVVMNTSHL